MFSFFDVLRGMLIGAACVLPGISGGTLALSMGVYESLLSAVSQLFCKPKNSLKTLAPFLVGCLLTLVAFTYMAEYLLSTHPYPFAMTVAGFLLGGTPTLFGRCQKEPHTRRQTFVCLLVLLVFLTCTLCFAAQKPPLDAGKPLPLLPQTLLITLALGLLYSVTMIVPGVSGSLLLMMFGYYYSLIETAKRFFEGLRLGNPFSVLSAGLILLPFVLGLFLGGFFLSSCITWLFDHFRFYSYGAILGILAASLFIVFHHMGVFDALFLLHRGELLCGLLLFLGGGILTHFLGEN